jgi:pectinesterase
MRIIYTAIGGYLLAAFLLYSPVLASRAGDGLLFEQLGSMVDIVVAADGSGDYLTVQAGINAVPDNNPERTVLFIKNGRYREKIMVPSSKINLTMIGENVDSTIIVYDDYAGKTPEMKSTVLAKKEAALCKAAFSFQWIDLLFCLDDTNDLSL